MKDAGKWALENRMLVHLLVVVLVVGGIMSFRDMSKLEDPELRVKQALVVTPYPGAAAREVEAEVTDRLERAIRAMKNLDFVESRSTHDLSMITVALSSLVKDDEIEQCWDLLRHRVSDARGQLPPGAGTPVVVDDFGDVRGIFYALTADGYSWPEIMEQARVVQRELQEVEGVASVSLHGEQAECIEIALREERVARPGALPVELVAALNGQQATLYAGYFDAGGHRARLGVSGRFNGVEDVEELLLQGSDGGQTRLKDIADVSLKRETPPRDVMRYDRREAVGIAIATMHGADVTRVGKAVKKRLDALVDRLPAGIDCHAIFFQPDRVDDAISDFMFNLLCSLLIVVVLVMLTMSFRGGVIIGCSLLVVVAGSFFILDLLDGTLQRVSLAAFVLAMGMLVDNAIVITDGILVDLQQGKARDEALTATGRKTALPLLAATLVAILAFFPIFLSPDVTGVYVRDLFIVLSISLLLSWILALTQVPIMARSMLRARAGKPFDGNSYRVLRGALGWCLRHKRVTVGIALLLLAAGIRAYFFLPREFFPDMDYDQLYIEYKLPEGTSSEQVLEELAEIEEYLLRREEITHATTIIAGSPPRYNLVRGISPPSLSRGELIVDFTSPGALVANMQEIQEYLERQYPGALARVKRYNLMYKPYPVEALFEGPDLDTLDHLARQAVKIMQAHPGLCLVNSSREPKTPALVAGYNRTAALATGISRQEVALSLLAANGGVPVGTFREGTRSGNIYLRIVDKEGKPVNALATLPVTSAAPPVNRIMNRETLQGLLEGTIPGEDLMETLRATVPLNSVADGPVLAWEDPVITRYNGQRTVSARANTVAGVSAASAREEILAAIEGIPLPDGYALRWEGEHEASARSTRQLFANLPMGGLLVIIILAALFRDYKKPLIILCCIPLTIVGAVIAMLLAGKALGFVAIVGALGLTGMIVKNGIVLMDEISSRVNSGVAPLEALVDSSVARFRPVMMASLTTICGMLPLVNDDLFGAGAVAIMGGLLFGALVALILLPVLHAVFFHVKTKQS
ncbi:MAG: efflux RND transporter permease subunit [Odoribacteraceae bacterium]|jgi:multidrug efflux pump subunit AcrB|nr:efflux RND transporter permease subunit [Odoribacteraceae bacterium]